MLATMGALTGCETTPPGAERGPSGTIAFNILLESSEPGVKLDVNGTPVGTTPLNLKVFGNKNRTFHDFGSYYFVIQALPLHTNQFTQTRVFRTGRGWTPQDHIPEHIYFDMNHPAPQYPTGAPGYPPPAYYSPPPYPYWPPYYYGPGPFFGPGFYFRGYW